MSDKYKYTNDKNWSENNLNSGKNAFKFND